MTKIPIDLRDEMLVLHLQNPIIFLGGKVIMAIKCNGEPCQALSRIIDDTITDVILTGATANTRFDVYLTSMDDFSKNDCAGFIVGSNNNVEQVESNRTVANSAHSDGGFDVSDLGIEVVTTEIGKCFSFNFFPLLQLANVKDLHVLIVGYPSDGVGRSKSELCAVNHDMPVLNVPFDRLEEVGDKVMFMVSVLGFDTEKNPLPGSRTSEQWFMRTGKYSNSIKAFNEEGTLMDKVFALTVPLGASFDEVSTLGKENPGGDVAVI